MRRLRPTARGWILTATGVCWLAVGAVNGVPVPYVLGCVVLALVVVSLGCVLQSLQGITVERGPVGAAAAGQFVSMPVIVTNRRRRSRHSLLIFEACPFAAEPVSRALVAGLKGGERRVVERRILALRRGEYQLGFLTLRGTDPAGLFFRERRLRLAQQVLVMPGTEPLSDLGIRRADAIVATTGEPVSASGQSLDFYAIREYNPADGLRRIHWRSSARIGKLMVREYERQAVTSVAVLVDAEAPFVSGSQQWSNLEYQVRAAASICRHIAGSYCHIAMGCGGARQVLMPPRLASRAENECLFTLATLVPGPVQLADVAFALAPSLPPHTVVFCLSLGTPVGLVAAMRVLVEQRLSVRWFCARRRAFAETRLRVQRSPGQDKRSQKELPVAVAELRPGMRLSQALALSG